MREDDTSGHVNIKHVSPWATYANVYSVFYTYAIMCIVKQRQVFRQTCRYLDDLNANILRKPVFQHHNTPNKSVCMTIHVNNLLQGIAAV